MGGFSSEAAISILSSSGEKVGKSFKRGIAFGTSGEFNHTFEDFFGFSKQSGSTLSYNIGSLYRNSSYRGNLTTKQYDFDSSYDALDTLSQNINGYLIGNKLSAGKAATEDAKAVASKTEKLIKEKENK